ncbi:hypothetical protein F7D01_00180 [Erythrobacter sp. 3-20A1M]|uniref:hypothetical protein n=1 Tax=Erythrobacter sp. 3-20A1M TaxID=2653850 RepID=UPI001BFC3CD5|nr:hypothetical protein [Erythrobacter sp. 3-20A1M]QWC55703.1 hypothetical protein F7D01_00180 [Erythrobacter sp. 3-20A1M]
MDEREPEKRDWVEDTREEITGMARGGMDHPSTKPVPTGLAIGALAGAVLPGLSIAIGAIAGGGFALYDRMRR